VGKNPWVFFFEMAVNVRRIILKHRRGIKCPFLNRFIQSSLTPSEGHFLSTEAIFAEWKAAVEMWTDGDSVSGQTAHLMKEKSFHRVRKSQFYKKG